jgi:hypothetical protein
MWDMQGGVSGSGGFPLLFNTAYAIELNAKKIILNGTTRRSKLCWKNRLFLQPEVYGI